MFYIISVLNQKNKMHWEISALNKLYKTNIFVTIKNRIVDNRFVFLLTKERKFDLQLK